MIHVNILTHGFVSPNGRAFLYPLLRNRNSLRVRGLTIELRTKITPDIADCDVLILDSKFFSNWWGKEQLEDSFRQFEEWRRQTGRLLFFDITDSAGWINGAALQAVDLYFKSQVLTDKSHYLKPLYGRRLFTDYYHRHDGVTDEKPEARPQVDDPALMDKIRVSWNSGMADYSLWGPYRMALYHRVPAPLLLQRPSGFADPGAERKIDVSCRMGINYTRETVCYQRRRIRDILGKHLRTDKLKRPAYFDELARSRITVSPFGLGEITLKDFEVFVTGGLLLKPDMSHMRTWPDFYRDGETMIAHAWDLSDLEQRIAESLDNRAASEDIARAGQQLYRWHLATKEGDEAFCDRFRGLVENALHQHRQ